MSNFSRRKLITTGLAATAGASGLAVAARLADRYGLIPPDCGGIYGAGNNPDLRFPAAADAPLAGPRIPCQPDLEGSVRKTQAFQDRSLRSPARRRVRGLAGRSGWHGRPPLIVLACRTQEFSLPQSDHTTGLRGGLVVHRGVDRRALIPRLEAPPELSPSPLRGLLFDPAQTGGKASTWPMPCIPRLSWSTG